MIIAGKASLFISVTARATSISLSWTGADLEDVSYVVTWQTDDIGGCSGGSYMNSTTINYCSTFDIMGLEEDSLYTITVTASSTTGSIATCNITAMTPEAGGTKKQYLILLPCINIFNPQLYLLLPLL